MFLKECIRKLLKGNRYNSATYIKHLRKIGCSIGDDVNIYEPTTVFIDETRPWLIKIGSHINITRGVTILTHGYDWAVLKTIYGEVLGSSGGVTIDDNVFIGMNTTVLKGVHIGKNVIIGANSLVNTDIPDNSVAAGNPCKVIMSVEEYYEKRKRAQLSEATELMIKYREKYGKKPDAQALHEFYWLFTNNFDDLDPVFKRMQILCGNEVQSNEKLQKNNKLFIDMDEFINSINK